MQPERWKQIEQLFIEALDREPPERELFLDQACAGDPWLRNELAALIRSHEAPDSLLDSPGPKEIIGRTIGRYEVLSLAGVGGMGEVYRARDIKLGRQVALKLLPDRFSDEPERVDRFEREAKILASLNHPNIAAIYDLEESDGIRCLVLEFVEGESLADRLSRDHIPIMEILEISRQISEALEAAHEQGVVHRDLKPANVMITPKGVVKVLDFGIARLLEPRSSPNSTVSSDSMTGGRVLGTASYMSPEQARGLPVDKRTDIWAFGCVLYEMLTGRRAFQGETLTDTLAAVVEREPDWQAGPKNVPLRIQEILRRCLHKDVRQRLRDIGDARIEIELSSQKRQAPNLSSSRSLRRWMPAVGGAVLVLLIAALAVYPWFTLPSAAPFERMEITRVTDSGKANAAAISADGTFVVHGNTENGKTSLWIRQAATESNLQILPPAIGNVFDMKVSRDGNSLYYWLGKISHQPTALLYSVPVLGGTPRKLMENLHGFHFSASISPDDQHLALARMNTAVESVLLRINLDGNGERQLASRHFPERIDAPAWSPDGKTIAYALLSYRRGEGFYHLETMPAQGGPAQRIGSHTWPMFLGAHWLPNGHGLIVLAGEQGGPGGFSQLWHVSYPDGKTSRITNDLNNYVSLSLNRDGSVLVAVQRELTSHIWVASMDGSGSARQVTSGRQDGNTYMSWTSDGKIVYSAPDNGQTTQVWITALDGSSPQQITRGPYTACPAVCGSGHLIFQTFLEGSHIWRSNLDGGGALQLTNGEGEFQPACSPDGTWLTYFTADQNSVGVWRMPIDGGKAVKIWDHYGLSQISPDGKWVLIHDYQTIPPKSVIIPASGGQALKTFDPDPELGLPWIWNADGRGLLYVRTSGGVSNVWLRSLDGRETKQLTTFDSDLIETNFGGVALSRDGKNLAVERGSTRSDIVLIKDLNAK